MAAIPFVVPFGLDGASDRAARRFVAGLPGADIAVENVPGAGGRDGVRRANALARAGGPVLLLGTPTTHGLLPARLGDEEAPLASFRPIALIESAPNVLLVSPALGVGSVEELVAVARRERLTYASAGFGQTIHACSALFCERAGLRMAHRPYDGGSATAYGDLVSGAVQVYFDNALACVEAVARGDAVALAVTTARRTPLLPGVPALEECGYPDFDLAVWLAAFGHGVEALFPREDTALARLVADSGTRWRAALAAALKTAA